MRFTWVAGSALPESVLLPAVADSGQDSLSQKSSSFDMTAASKAAQASSEGHEHGA